MIRIGSDTDIGMNRNSTDWFGMNSYPILSAGLTVKFFLGYSFYKYIYISERLSINYKGTQNIDKQLFKS